jgi:ankyrin repeat protein
MASSSHVSPGALDMLSVLISIGADPTRTDKDGQTPRQFAESKGRHEAAEYLAAQEL